MTRNMECALIGIWRIVGADLWDRDYLDLVEPAYITLEDHGLGEFAFGCVNGGLDYEYSSQIIFFTWQGFDEMDEVGGGDSSCVYGPWREPLPPPIMKVAKCSAFLCWRQSRQRLIRNGRCHVR